MKPTIRLGRFFLLLMGWAVIVGVGMGLLRGGLGASGQSSAWQTVSILLLVWGQMTLTILANRRVAQGRWRWLARAPSEHA